VKKVGLSMLVLGVSASLTATAVAQTAPPEEAAPMGAPVAAPAAPAPNATVAVTPPSEKRPSPNSVYAEGLGAGLAYSLNYERLVIDDLGVRAGISYLSMGASASAGGQTSTASASMLSIPITASYIGVRKGKHALELGGGATIIRSSGSSSGFGVSASGSGMTAIGSAMVGYRIHPLDRAGFQFRVGLMALAGKGLGLSTRDPGAFGVLPWGYLSMGASF
jgi:hypothetical protein